MKDFRDKVAVITGAASGIGRGLAERCAEEGMKVVLADVEEEPLASTEREMIAKGATALAVHTDVSKTSDVETLAQKTLDAFGAVHLLCNNAGVSAGGPAVWEATLADWEWVLGVNLWGVIHGVHVFTPIMLEQGDDCHIVNTASGAGLTSSPENSAVYTVSKHGIVALSEVLYFVLLLREAKVGVSVLCPGFVNTRIMDPGRNRPSELMNDPTMAQRRLAAPGAQAARQAWVQSVSEGMTPREVAALVLNAVREEKFYILANADSFKGMFQARLEDIVQERNPTLVVPDLKYFDPGRFGERFRPRESI